MTAAARNGDEITDEQWSDWQRASFVQLARLVGAVDTLVSRNPSEPCTTRLRSVYDSDMVEVERRVAALTDGDRLRLSAALAQEGGAV